VRLLRCPPSGEGELSQSYPHNHRNQLRGALHSGRRAGVQRRAGQA
jgi:hypothetical protein